MVAKSAVKIATCLLIHISYGHDALVCAHERCKHEIHLQAYCFLEMQVKLRKQTNHIVAYLNCQFFYDTIAQK